MPEDKKSLIDLVPDSIDNAVKNITDKPSQNMGTTLADIWYLVFGGISQAAEKRKLKYTYALQEFENELKEKISKIPKDKLVEPDMQIVAQALEKSKYCVEKEELRDMFSSLISSTMNKDLFVSPIMVDIVSSLSPMDAKILHYLYKQHSSKLDINKIQDYLGTSYDGRIFCSSIIELEHLDLIFATPKKYGKIRNAYQNIQGFSVPVKNVKLSSLGFQLCEICIK